MSIVNHFPLLIPHRFDELDQPHRRINRDSLTGERFDVDAPSGWF